MRQPNLDYIKNKKTIGKKNKKKIDFFIETIGIKKLVSHNIEFLVKTIRETIISVNCPYYVVRNYLLEKLEQKEAHENGK